MLYAVIVSGGKQHRVQEGEILRLEKINAEIGDNIEFDFVLLFVDGDNVRIGSPYLEGVKVTAEVVAQDRSKKIHIIKFKRRKNYMRQAGHRQWFTEIKITGISE